MPKIENMMGINNIQEIIDELKYEKKIIMLDHDDLYSSLARLNEPSSNFKIYINTLIDFCKNNDVTLLRTVGVVFSDDEERTTQYIK